jgi:hypothetical protein
VAPRAFKLKRQGVATRLPPPLEAAEQESFVGWWRYQLPSVRILAIPNGAFLFGDPARRAAQMVRLKKAGLEPGVPDLFCPAWLLWPELKRTVGGVISDEQADWHAYLRSIGHTVIVARGAESAIRQVKAFVVERAKT